MRLFAHPVVRLSFGALFFMAIFAFVMTYEAQLFGREPLWQESSRLMPLISVQCSRIKVR